jgi:hypothetical protein
MVVGVGSCKVDSNFPPVLKVMCAKFYQNLSKTVDLHTKQTNQPTNKQTFSFIYSVETLTGIKFLFFPAHILAHIWFLHIYSRKHATTPNFFFQMEGYAK